ncbi:MAG: hypothetical protein IKG93_00395 [Clostridiales bacterium]|nr:hypothetical protein [Clostridiales bacterium]
MAVKSLTIQASLPPNSRQSAFRAVNVKKISSKVAEITAIFPIFSILAVMLFFREKN